MHLASSLESKSIKNSAINSLAPGKCDCNFRFVIFKLKSGIDIFIMYCPYGCLTVNIASGNGLVLSDNNPDSKVRGANMGPIWGRQDPGGLHVGPMFPYLGSHYLGQCCPRPVSSYVSLDHN